MLDKKPSLRDLLFESDPEKVKEMAEKLGKNINCGLSAPKFTHRFKDEVKEKSIWIPKSPYPEDWGKPEKIIEKEHEFFFAQNKICYFNTKVKGEIQAAGKGKFVLKKSENVGFFDMVLIINGKFVGLELKHGDGGYWKPNQQKVAYRVRDLGLGYTLVSNSVKLTHGFLKKKGLTP